MKPNLTRALAILILQICIVLILAQGLASMASHIDVDKLTTALENEK